MNWGGRYEVLEDGTWISLNYAERGMIGSTMNKPLPKHLAEQNAAQYAKEEAYRQKRHLTTGAGKKKKERLKAKKRGLKASKKVLTKKDLARIKPGAIKLFGNG